MKDKEIINLLKKDSSFMEITDDMKEGKDYISLVDQSATLLGRALATTNRYKFDTVIGRVLSISKFMQYISTKDFPSRFLLKHNYSRDDNTLISKLETLELPNYWAAMAYATCCRIAQDDKVKNLLKENKLPLTIVRYELRNKYIPDEIEPKLIKYTKLGNYLAIVRDIEILLKNDLFTEENITTLVDFYKTDKDLEVFSGSNIK